MPDEGQSQGAKGDTVSSAKLKNKARAQRTETGAKDAGDLTAWPIRLPWGTLTIGAVISIVTFLGSSAYLLIDKFLVQPEVEKRRTADALLSARDAEIGDLKKRFEIGESNLRQIRDSLKRPVLLSPKNDEAIIADTVEFKWEFSDNFQSTANIEILGSRTQPYRFQVLHPEQQLTHVPRRYLGDGEFFWRIVPGAVSTQADAIESNSGSTFSHFALYDSAIQRVTSTRELRVGLTATFEGPFNYPDADGHLVGIDIDVINWLSQALAEQFSLPAPLRPRLFNMAWQELLPSLSRGNIDIIVSHMTASQTREAEHPGVKFSKPYLKVGVALLSRTKVVDYWNALKGRIVGAVRESTNEKAAKYLADKYGFSVSSKYNSSTEAILALDRGEVQFVVTDETLLSDDFSPSQGYYIYKDGLAKVLTPFYKSEYGNDRSSEELSVAVNILGSTRLLDGVNSVFDSSTGRSFLEKEIECWVKRGKYACENSKKLELIGKPRN
jgi:ABC-type amino acid transport substrate-binding protein